VETDVVGSEDGGDGSENDLVGAHEAVESRVSLRRSGGKGKLSPDEIAGGCEHFPRREGPAADENGEHLSAEDVALHSEVREH
jgi:hypothetical protein